MNQDFNSSDDIDKIIKTIKELLRKIAILTIIDKINIIRTIITIIIIYYVVKKINQLLINYPRPISLITSTLDIAGKFDKSTGLDREMAKIASHSIANYITIPNIINNYISNNIQTSNLNLSDSQITNNEIKDYLNTHLFKNYTHNTNNKNKDLRELL